MTAPAAQTESTKLLDIKGLVKHFPLEGSTDVLRAVDGVSFDIRSGETLGLVGESGCGKSTVGRCILRLYEPTSGQIRFEDKDITHASTGDMRLLRLDMQIIFQDPYSSLNPRLTILSIVSEPMTIHGIGDKNERRDRVASLLKKVGLDPTYMNRYPHEFS